MKGAVMPIVMILVLSWSAPGLPLPPMCWCDSDQHVWVWAWFLSGTTVADLHFWHLCHKLVIQHLPNNSHHLINDVAAGVFGVSTDLMGTER